MTGVPCPTCTDYVLDQDGTCAKCGRAKFTRQSDAALHLANGRDGVHVSRNGLVTGVRNGTAFGHVVKLPGRARTATFWAVRPYIDPPAVSYARYCWNPSCAGCGKNAPHSIGFRYTSVPARGSNEFEDRWVNDETGEVHPIEVDDDPFAGLDIPFTDTSNS